MKAHNGALIRAGQKWLDANGDKYLVIGFSSEGFPVLEALSGIKAGEFFDVKTPGKSFFLRSVTDCKHKRYQIGHVGSTHCLDCLEMLA